jgi:hypothetical protein
VFEVGWAWPTIFGGQDPPGATRRGLKAAGRDARPTALA